MLPGQPGLQRETCPPTVRTLGQGPEPCWPGSGPPGRLLEGPTGPPEGPRLGGCGSIETLTSVSAQEPTHGLTALTVYAVGKHPYNCTGEEWKLPSAKVLYRPRHLPLSEVPGGALKPPEGILWPGALGSLHLPLPHHSLACNSSRFGGSVPGNCAGERDM